MNLILRIIPYLLVSFIISFALTPLVKKIGFASNVYAVENKRTVHHGKIVRIGGLGIYVAFLIGMAIFVKADKTFNAIMIGGLVVFLGGLIDDIYDLKPMVKMAFQIVGALIVVLMGDVQLDAINFSFIHLNFSPIAFIVTMFWIVGVTNAINLIDGLDGLSSGITVIVLCVTGLIAYFMKRIDVSTVALILIGAIMGFLPYNFHPASIFVGDCGALFMGFMLACLSLLGFKTSTFITLGFPIIILFVPLADTSLAIIRRKAKGQKVTDADRSHLHHILMYRLGLSHRNSVLLLYGITALFGSCAILTFFHEKAGLIMLIILCIISWLFVELTGMIKPTFHPLIGLFRKITGHPRKSDDAFFEANRINHKE